jgi:hypothetical protein
MNSFVHCPSISSVTIKFESESILSGIEKWNSLSTDLVDINACRWVKILNWRQAIENGECWTLRFERPVLSVDSWRLTPDCWATSPGASLQ